MLSRARLLVAVTTFVVAIGAGNAAAASFRIEPAGAIRATSEGSVTFAAGASRIECTMVLTGRLREGLIEKVQFVVFGEITRVEWAGCRGGEIERVLNLAWPLKLNGIIGTLPERVTSILFFIERVSIMFTVLGLNCLYGEELGLGAQLALEGRNPYTAGRIRVLEVIELPLNRAVSNALCPRAGTMRGNFNLAAAQRITRS